MSLPSEGLVRAVVATNNATEMNPGRGPSVTSTHLPWHREARLALNYWVTREVTNPSTAPSAAPWNTTTEPEWSLVAMQVNQETGSSRTAQECYNQWRHQQLNPDTVYRIVGDERQLREVEAKDKVVQGPFANDNVPSHPHVEQRQWKRISPSARYVVQAMDDAPESDTPLRSVKREPATTARSKQPARVETSTKPAATQLKSQLDKARTDCGARIVWLLSPKERQQSRMYSQ